VIENVTSAPVIKPVTIPANHGDDLSFVNFDRHGRELSAAFGGESDSFLELGILDLEPLSESCVATRAPQHLEPMAERHNYRCLRLVAQAKTPGIWLALVFFDVCGSPSMRT
jgi:hypothetical protein